MLTALLTGALILERESTSVMVYYKGALNQSLQNYCQARHNTGSAVLYGGAVVVLVSAPPSKVWKWVTAYRDEFGGKAHKSEKGEISLVPDYKEGEKHFSKPVNSEGLRRRVKRNFPVWNAVSYAIKTGTLMQEDHIVALDYLYSPFCNKDGSKGLYFYGKVKLFREGKVRYISL